MIFYRNYINRTINTKFETVVRRKKPYLKRIEKAISLRHRKAKFDIGEDIYFDKAPLPELYYTNEIVLMPKNKTTIFAYWEIREDDYLRLKEEKNVFENVTILIYKKDYLYKKINGLGRIGSYYITNIRANRNYRAVIGFENDKGEFFELSKSSEVVSPKGRVSRTKCTKWGIPYTTKEHEIKLNVYTKDNLPKDYILTQEITDSELVKNNEDLTEYSENSLGGSSEYLGSSNNNVDND